jgi:hypothetical protein
VGGGEKRQRWRSEGDEDRGSSVAAVNERQEKEGSMHRSHGRGWRRARGGTRREHACSAVVTTRRPTPFEAEAGEAGEGWGSGVRRHVEGKNGGGV